MNVYPVAQDVFRDVVSYSFSAVMIGMVVATVFLFLERSRVNAKARLTITVAGLITLAASMSYAAMNYQYSSGFFTSKLVEFRYADWTITTPLLLLKLVTMAGWRKVGKGTIAALLFLDIFMIGTGYVGEQQINHLAVAAGMTASTAAGAADGVVWTMFFVSCIAWLALAGILLTKVKAAGADLEPEEKSALNLLLLFPLVLWAVYPLGYVFRATLGAVGFWTDLTQFMFNISDFLAKAVFGYISWGAIQAIADRKVSGYAYQGSSNALTGDRGVVAGGTHAGNGVTMPAEERTPVGV